MFCFILWLMAVVVSQSQSTEESAICHPEMHQFCKQQMEWGGQGAQPDLELTGRWRGLLLSQIPVIIHGCLNKIRVLTLWGWRKLSAKTGMDGMVWEDDHLWAVTVIHFGGKPSGVAAARSWVPQDIQSWVIPSRWWGSFQPLYLGQVALPQAFSISKPWSFIPKSKNSLFQHRMRQRSSCTECPTVMEQDITIIAARWLGFAFIIGIAIHLTGVLRFPSQNWHLTDTW